MFQRHVNITPSLNEYVVKRSIELQLSESAFIRMLIAQDKEKNGDKKVQR
jgi:hypothetical protein